MLVGGGVLVAIGGVVVSSGLGVVVGSGLLVGQVLVGLRVVDAAGGLPVLLVVVLKIKGL